MCARYELNQTGIKPGMRAGFWHAVGQSSQLEWAGFAKRESLAWWKRNGSVLVDVPAHRFAERSDQIGELIWDEVPTGQVVRGHC